MNSKNDIGWNILGWTVIGCIVAALLVHIKSSGLPPDKQPRTIVIQTQGETKSLETYRIAITQAALVLYREDGKVDAAFAAGEWSSFEVEEK